MGASLGEMNGKYFCKSSDCEYTIAYGGFQVSRGKPVFINFKKCDSVCHESDYSERSEAYTNRPRRLTVIREMILKIIGGGGISQSNCKRFIAELKKNVEKPSILIIGSGTAGNGTELLYRDDAIGRIGIDIYATSTVDYIADAHFLPFKNESFDGVWIQAVLEHVLWPVVVVSEMNRVLKPKGLIYSEIPFMQQVHEGAYDFQRYTPTGHVAIYCKNIIVSSGVLGGPGDSFTWSVRYLIWALSRSRSIARILSLPLRWVMMFVDFIIPEKYKYDNCTGSFVLARKPDGPYQTTARELIRFYAGGQR